MFSRATFVRHLLPSLCFAAALISASEAGAQSVLYITDGDASKLQAIDTTTGNILFTTTSSRGAYPIAVRENVVLGNRYNPGVTGEYNRATGTLIGSTQTPIDPFDWDQALDGAAGIDENYTLSWGVGAVEIFRTDINWSNPVQLFAAPDTAIYGLTYDSQAGTLWLASATAIYQYSTAGTLISQFANTGKRGGIAYQASTDTLWLVPNDPDQALLQFSKTGTLLNSLTVTGRSGNIFGAEFQAIPEPSTYALLALGGATLIFLHRRRPVSRK